MMTGGGGSGGDGPAYACEPFGNVVEILSKADLNNTTEIDEEVIVSFDNQGYVHVFVTDNSANQLVARTVRDDELGQLIKYPPMPGMGDVRTFGALTFGTSIQLAARVDNDFQLLQFDKNGNELATNPPTLLNVPKPLACDPPAQQERLWASFDEGDVYLLGTCTNNNVATIFGSEVPGGTVNFQFSGNPSDPLYRPSQYVHAGANIIITSGENPSNPNYGAFVRVGDDAMIPMMQPIPISLEQDKAAFPFALVRANGNMPGVFALIASLTADSPSLTPATLYGGVVQGMDLPAFLMNQGGFLSPAIDFPNQSSILFVTPPNPAFGRYVSAGLNLFSAGPSQVSIQWWSPEGQLYTSSVINEITDTMANGRHTYVAAGGGNQLFYYVVWARQDADMQFVVEGTRVASDVVTP